MSAMAAEPGVNENLQMQGGVEENINTALHISFMYQSHQLKHVSKLLSIRKIKKQQFRLSITRLIIAAMDGNLLKWDQI
jgi:hypothetical protein